MSAEILCCPTCPAESILPSWDVAWFGDRCPKCQAPGQPLPKRPGRRPASFYDLFATPTPSYIERIRGTRSDRPIEASAVATIPKRATPKRVAALLRTVATAHNGQRNSVLYWAAMRMAEYDMDHAGAAQQLLDAALLTGLPSAEAGRTIASALGVNPAKAVTR
jgi:hypothetical protein